MVLGLFSISYDILPSAAHCSAANPHSTCWIPLGLQYKVKRAGNVECIALSESEWVQRRLRKCLCVRESYRVCVAQLYSSGLHDVTSGHTQLHT